MDAFYVLVCFMHNLDIRAQGSMILPHVDSNNQSVGLFFYLFISYDMHIDGQLNMSYLCEMKKFFMTIKCEKIAYIFHIQLDSKLTYVRLFSYRSHGYDIITVEYCYHNFSIRTMQELSLLYW